LLKLEDLLNEVDAVDLPTEPIDDVTRTRKARHEIVTDIVAAMDGIERFIQPETPAESIPETEESESSDIEDLEETAFVDREIQRVIQETLARKRDEETRNKDEDLSSKRDSVLSRRSVTVEDVPDEEY
jgi:hypothetical protein